MTGHSAVLALVLVAAALHALWNALVKANPDRLLATALVGCGAVGIALLILPWLPLPARGAWPYLLTSMLLHVLYFSTLTLAYRGGDLSQVYPVARGSAPLLLAALSFGLVGERVGVLGLAGIAVVSVGILSLALERGLPWRQDWRPLAWALGTGGLTAVYTLVDGLGARLSGQVVSYTLWLNLGAGLPWVAVLGWVGLRRRWRLRRRAVAMGLGAGMLAVVPYALVLWAMTLGALAEVAALRETSVIFAALLGMVLLKEPFGRRRLLAAALVVSGAALIQAGA